MKIKNNKSKPFCNSGLWASLFDNSLFHFRKYPILVL